MMKNRFLFRTLLLLLCVAVGLSLAARDCPGCGTSNADDARFCLSCGQELPRVRPEPAPRPRPLPELRVNVVDEPGGAYITSTPAGAAVVVDGTRRGTTPLRLTGLAPGSYELELTRTGHQPYATRFTVTRPAFTVRVTTVPPGAEVLIDDRVVGTVPDTGLVITGLDAGSHGITARLEGRPDQQRTVTLDPDEPHVSVEVVFPPPDGFLGVTSDPLGAGLSIDGEPVGRTRYFAPHRPARYRLELTREGFRPWLGETRVRPGDTTLVSAVLLPVRERRWGLLALGAAGIAGGATGALLGQAAYDDYRATQSPEEAVELRRKTMTLDWVRNIAGGIGILSLGAFFYF